MSSNILNKGFVFALFIVVFSTYSSLSKACNIVDTFEVQFKLETDTIREGQLNLQKFSENYFMIINGNNMTLCFNEVPICQKYEHRSNSNLDANTILYFPIIEYFNRQDMKWELRDFYSMIGDSGEPSALIGDSTVCLKKNHNYKFGGLFLLNALQFLDKGKFRIYIKVFYRLGNEYIIRKSNYHYLYW